jgi:hypothetical protein
MKSAHRTKISRMEEYNDRMERRVVGRSVKEEPEMKWDDEDFDIR